MHNNTQMKLMFSLTNENFSLQEDYVSSLFGGNKGKHLIKGHHEQIQRVDCFKAIEGSDVLLLHLQKGIRYSRFVMPSSLGYDG